MSELNHVKSCLNIFQTKGITPLRLRMTEESSLSNSIKLKNKIREYNNILGRNGFKSDYDKEKEEKDKQILLKAQRDKEENMDEVKTMNSLLLSAKLAVIRDKQIEEKKKNKIT